VGFEQDRPGYGWRGLLGDLEASRPRLVVLQRRDWDPYEQNSDVWFKAQPALASWLSAGYERTTDLHNFEIWTRR